MIGVEVGHGQLHPKIKNHRSVEAFEKTDARHIGTILDLALQVSQQVNLLVADISFVSITKVFGAEFEINKIWD